MLASLRSFAPPSVRSMSSLRLTLGLTLVFGAGAQAQEVFPPAPVAPEVVARDEQGRTTVRALVPESELYKYAATLRSMTQGRASHSRKLAGYEPAPPEIAKKVAAERAEEEAH